jgi:cathepsin X
LVEIGCEAYLAKDPQKHKECDPIFNCRTCNGPTCTAVDYNRKWYAKEYGTIVGKKEMQKEIYGRGPISCGIDATNKFYNDYKGGIYRERKLFVIEDHAVSVVGWGNDPKEGDYWIVRNSWGSAWGENGYFKIVMHDGNLGLGENPCYWAVPSLQKP